MNDKLREDFGNAVSYYERTWRVLDETLYRLCRENPRHNSKAAVCAKLWIIGRTYATGIERKVATSGAQGSSMSQVADLFHAHAGEIDAWFDELQTVSEPLTPAKLSTIVSLHGRLVQLLRPLTRRQQSTRSFVSKYMQFHNPAVPIYDSIAAAALRGAVPWKSALAIFEKPIDADDEYMWYTMRFFSLYKQVLAFCLECRVRHVDHYLLSLADSKYTAVVSRVTLEDK